MQTDATANSRIAKNVATYSDPYFCADMTPNFQREVAFTRLWAKPSDHCSDDIVYTWYVHPCCQSPLNCCELLWDASETLILMADKWAKQSNNQIIYKMQLLHLTYLYLICLKLWPFSVNCGCLMIGALNLAALMPFPKSASFAKASELTWSGNGKTFVGGLHGVTKCWVESIKESNLFRTVEHKTCSCHEVRIFALSVRILWKSRARIKRP